MPSHLLFTGSLPFGKDNFPISRCIFGKALKAPTSEFTWRWCIFIPQQSSRCGCKCSKIANLPPRKSPEIIGGKFFGAGSTSWSPRALDAKLRAEVAKCSGRNPRAWKQGLEIKVWFERCFIVSSFHWISSDIYRPFWWSIVLLLWHILTVHLNYTSFFFTPSLAQSLGRWKYCLKTWLPGTRVTCKHSWRSTVAGLASQLTSGVVQKLSTKSRKFMHRNTHVWEDRHVFLHILNVFWTVFEIVPKQFEQVCHCHISSCWGFKRIPLEPLGFSLMLWLHLISILTLLSLVTGKRRRCCQLRMWVIGFGAPRITQWPGWECQIHRNPSWGGVYPRQAGVGSEPFAS